MDRADTSSEKARLNLQRSLETIHSCGESLLTIVNDILDSSKIESGKLEIERHPCELGPLIESATRFFESVTQKKSVTLRTYVDPKAPQDFNGDPGRIRQILVNLLSNAVKFTESGEITVKVSSLRLSGNTHELLFSVSDTGIGIAPEDRHKLFVAFSQVDTSTSRKYGGSGLGLAICKRLSELMGGRIWFESEPGQGSTFHFSVRVSTAELVTETNSRPQSREKPDHSERP